MIKTRLFTLVTDAKKYIIANVILQWFSMMANVVMVYAIAWILRYCTGGSQEALSKLPYLFGIALVTVIIRIVCTKYAATTSFYASKSVKKELRGAIYQKLLRLGSSYRLEVPTAEVVQLAGEGVEQLETYFGSYLPQFFYSLLAPLTLFVVVARLRMKVAVILLICVPLMPMIIVFVQKFAKKLLSKYWGQYAELGDSFLENLQGLNTLKIYQADEARHQAMNKEAEHFRVITMKVLTMQLNSIIIMDIVAYGGAALGIALALLELWNGRLDFTGCFIIILLSAEFFLPMRKLGSYFHVAMNGMAASDKIFHLLDLPEPEGRTASIGEGDGIVLRDVHFSYQEGTEVLHGVNLQFVKGSFTSIVGVSGCGKSTIANLLMHRNTGYSGSITINGTELSDIKDSELAGHITYISYNSHLFKGTVRENLLMAKPDAEDKELWSVIEKVRLKDFLTKEHGLDTFILENAANLSGGQKQRLALARALLHDSPVYIFDEATSNIDVESENNIMALVHELSMTKTVILISHRLANVVKSDWIYVLDRGTVMQQGTHDALLGETKENRIYKALWDEQEALYRLGGMA